MYHHFVYCLCNMPLSLSYFLQVVCVSVVNAHVIHLYINCRYAVHLVIDKSMYVLGYEYHADVQCTCIDLEVSIADCKYSTILSTLGHSELNV